MKKSLIGITVFSIAVPALISGCATIVSKTSYPVSVNCNPPGSTVSVTDKKGIEVFRGQSPATVTLKAGAGFFSKAAYQIRLSSPGYTEQVITVHYKLNGWYFGNLLFGGLIGMLIVDPATGAMWKLETPPINVTLDKATVSVETPTLKIIDIASVSKDMRERLVRIK